MKLSAINKGPLLLSAALGCLFSAPAIADSSFDIVRDSWGVPHIYSSDVFGLYAGFGYAVAQDRMFQMEMARRAVSGQVAEVLGPDRVSYDIQARSKIDQEDIRRQIAALSEEERDILRGYAAGFNTWVDEALADREKSLPKQFVDFGFEPEHWDELDVAMIYVGTMAGRFSGNSSELGNAQVLVGLQKAHGEEKGKALFDQLFWSEDIKAPTTVPPGEQYERDAGFRTIDGARFADLDGISGLLGDDQRPRASNIWIASPNNTTDGSTILINGPQFGNFNPAYVFNIGLHGAGFDLTGNTPFAVPNVLFGTNGTIAWGATAGPRDVNDYYRLELNPENARQYKVGDAWRDMTPRSETIKIKGAPAIETVFWESDYGTVSFLDPDNGVAYGFKRSWEGKEIQTLIAWVNSTKAQSYDEWLRHAEKVATTINWYYADRDGNIGYVSPGDVPQRAIEHDERLPAEVGRDDWIGIRPFAESPKVYNPEQGWIANWNNRSSEGGTANLEGTPWGQADRVLEISSRLDSDVKLTPQEIWDINRQISFLDINARYFLPIIAEAADGVDPNSKRGEMAKVLSGWDAQMLRGEDGRATTPAVGIFQTWLDVMVEDVLNDDTSEFPTVVTYNRISRSSQALYNALLGERSGIPEAYDFLNGADEAEKQEIVLAALDKAADRLSENFGSDDIDDWRIDVREHVFLTDNYLGIPQANADEVLAIGTEMNRGTENNRVTFNNGEVEFCAVSPPGQSGFINLKGEKSPHYDDQLTLYNDFGCRIQPHSKEDVDLDTTSREAVTVMR